MKRLAPFALLACLLAGVPLLAGNTISGYDTIEGAVIAQPYGNYYITNANKAASAAITAGIPVEIGGTAADGGSVSFTIATADGGRATYTGTLTREFHVTVSLSVTSTQSNEILWGWIAKNGTVITGAGMPRKLGTGTDTGAMALECVVSLATNDYIEVYIDLDVSSSDTVTAEAANVTLAAIGQ